MPPQVWGGASPQWAEMHLDDRDDIAFASMHGLHSDQLHIHIYAAAAPIGPQHTAEDSSLSRSSQAEAEPRSNTAPPLNNGAKTVPDGMKMSYSNHDSKATGGESLSEGQIDATNKDSFPNGTTDTKWRRPDTELTADAAHSAQQLQLQDSKAHPAGCSAKSSSCKLILAADVTLNSLERLHDILGGFRLQHRCLVAKARSGRSGCMVIFSFWSSMPGGGDRSGMQGFS